MRIARANLRGIVTFRNKVSSVCIDVKHQDLHSLSITHSFGLLALQVLTAEGEKLPWIIVLQPEHTDSGTHTYQRH